MCKKSYVLTEEGRKKVKDKFEALHNTTSASHLARELNLDRGTIIKLQQGSKGVNENTLERLCKELGWDLEFDLIEGSDYNEVDKNCGCELKKCGIG